MLQGDFELTLGARPLGPAHTHFRVWAPRRLHVDVRVLEAHGLRHLPLARTEGGYFEATLPVPTGAPYTYRLDGGDALPDPASRFQPQGPHGPSQVVDPRHYVWQDAGWKGPGLEGQVLYELHVGTFTPERDCAGGERRLPELKALGVTALALMPLHTFPGRFNWGYDGVTLFAPCAVYGEPDELRRLVDAAHAHGLSVILDVVYDHLGPDGNSLAQFCPGYFSTRYEGEWGQPTNFDDFPNAAGSRDFFIQNACDWVSEFHVDGLRLDATQSLFDAGLRHVLQELSERVRRAAGEQGQYSRWQKKPRGTPLLHTPAPRAVFYLQNHDQLANLPRGERLAQLAGAARTRALTSLLLLLPQTPLLFMGQEWAASAPFFYFVDHTPQLMRLVERGRNAYVSQFDSARHALQTEGYRIPFGEEAVGISTLDWTERERAPHRAMLRLHTELLWLRREDRVFAAQARERLEGAVLGEHSLVLRYLGGGQDGDRLLILNLGPTLELSPCPEPLLAPVAGKHWHALLSSEETRFGGGGAAPPATDGQWRIPGQSACVLTSEETKA